MYQTVDEHSHITIDDGSPARKDKFLNRKCVLTDGWIKRLILPNPERLGEFRVIRPYQLRSYISIVVSS
jgi:hypothetical protein